MSIVDLSQLSAPFEPDDVEWFIGATTEKKDKGLAIPFITNRAVMERLDAVCGITGWKNEYKTLGERELKDKDGSIIKKTSQLCGISIRCNDRNEWITKWDGAEESDIEAIKGSLSSAMKRAAVQYGIGRYLYKLESPWVEIEKRGRSYVMKSNQKIILPAWAMPGGSGNPAPGENRRPTVQIIGYEGTNNTTPPQNMPQNAPQNTTGQQISTLSDKQINRAYKKAEAAGKSEDEVMKYIKIKYNKDNIKQLNRKEYDELCATLDRNAQ